MGYHASAIYLLRSATAQDTLVARMIAERGMLDWTSGILQLVVLMLGVATLIVMVMLLITVRRSALELNAALQRLAQDTRPLIAAASAVATDAREVVALIRTDVERLTDAAHEVSEHLIEAAETTATRVDDVNAVLDVLQGELEDTAIDAAAVVRGLRVGALRLTQPPRRPTRDPRDRR